MRLYVCWDGDHIGREVGRAVMTDDVAAVRRVDQAIMAGNELWRSFALRSNGTVIEIGGDEGRIELGAEYLTELAAVAAQYAKAVGATVSVGVGMKLSESAKALLVAKLRGGNQINLWQPDMQAELDATPQKTEGEKVADEYLTNSLGKARQLFEQAAFRHNPTGTVVPSGSHHDLNAIDPAAYERAEYDEGFIDGKGKFFTRADAAKVVDEPWLYSEDFLQKANTASNTGAHAGFGGHSTPVKPSVMPGQGDHEQGQQVKEMIAQEAQDTPPSPEATHAAEDLEDQLHAEASKQQAADDQKAQQEGGAKDQLRNQLVQILNVVRTKAPVIAQMKQADPEAYQAVMALVQAVIALGREIMGEAPAAPPEPSHVQAELDKSEEPLEKFQPVVDFPGLGVERRRDTPIVTTKKQHALRLGLMGAAAARGAVEGFDIPTSGPAGSTVNMTPAGRQATADRKREDYRKEMKTAANRRTALPDAAGQVSTVPGNRAGFVLAADMFPKGKVGPAHTSQNAASATQLHEDFHQVMGRVADRFGRVARYKVAQHLVAGVSQAARNWMFAYAAKHHKYNPNHPLFDEERIALLHDYLNNPEARQSFHARMGPGGAPASPERAREIDTHMKQAHRIIRERAAALTPEQIEGLGKDRTTYWKDEKEYSDSHATDDKGYCASGKDEYSGSPETPEGDLDKTAGPIPGTPSQHHLHLPVGSQVNDRIKVQHEDGSESWIEARSGTVRSQDPTGHPASAREPGAR